MQFSSLFGLLGFFCPTMTVFLFAFLSLTCCALKHGFAMKTGSWLPSVWWVFWEISCSLGPCPSYLMPQQVTSCKVWPRSPLPCTQMCQMGTGRLNSAPGAMVRVSKNRVCWIFCFTAVRFALRRARGWRWADLLCVLCFFAMDGSLRWWQGSWAGSCHHPTPYLWSPSWAPSICVYTQAALTPEITTVENTQGISRKL